MIMMLVSQEQDTSGQGEAKDIYNGTARFPRFSGFVWQIILSNFYFSNLFMATFFSLYEKQNENAFFFFVCVLVCFRGTK